MAEVEASDVTPPEEGVRSNLTPPEVATTPEVGPTSTVGPPDVVPTEKLATKKPRKPRPAKVVTELATVTEGASGSETTPTAQEAQLPLWSSGLA